MTEWGMNWISTSPMRTNAYIYLETEFDKGLEIYQYLFTAVIWHCIAAADSQR